MMNRAGVGLKFRAAESSKPSSSERKHEVMTIASPVGATGRIPAQI